MIKKGYFCNSCLAENNFSLGIFCPICLKKRPFSQEFLKSCCEISLKSLISFVDYESHISNLVGLGKFRGYFDIFKSFAEIILNELELILPYLQGFTLIPIPLSEKDERKRGFNQSEILALSLSERLNLNYSNCLIKVKENNPQRLLPEKERFKNIQGVFGLKQKPERKVILVDDIKTTGATLLEAARVLREGGSRIILGLTIVK